MELLTVPTRREQQGLLAKPIVIPDAERAARAQMRRQIARLESQLGAQASPHAATGRLPAPRVLDLEGLERVRDDLVERIALDRDELIRCERAHAQARLQVERMLADPRGHRFARVSFDQLGLKGCGGYAVRPRLGLVGMLAGWWEIRLSSGCPRPRPGAISRRAPQGTIRRTRARRRARAW